MWEDGLDVEINWMGVLEDLVLGVMGEGEEEEEEDEAYTCGAEDEETG